MMLSCDAMFFGSIFLRAVDVSHKPAWSEGTKKIEVLRSYAAKKAAIAP
jgi:hypothetical protein